MFLRSVECFGFGEEFNGFAGVTRPSGLFRASRVFGIARLWASQFWAYLGLQTRIGVWAFLGVRARLWAVRLRAALGISASWGFGPFSAFKPFEGLGPS